MQQSRCPDGAAWASAADADELLGLEFYVGDFLAMYLFAYFAEDDRRGRIAKGWITDLRDYLGGDQDAD